MNISFFDFMKSTEGIENSLDFAIKHGLLPGRHGYTCIKCDREDSLRWTRNTRSSHLPYMFVCAMRNCRATVALGRNTLFDHISFPVSIALRLIYFWLLRISSQETSDQLKLKETVVVEWFKIFKEVCAYVIINYTKAIGGPGHTVEVCHYQLLTRDESHDVWLLTGVERSSGQNFVIHVEDLDCQTLWPILKNYILPGTIVVTEKATEFTRLEKNEGSQSLSFVLPTKFPRQDDHYHLDELFNALKKSVDAETPPDQISNKELYAYKFLYFNRDGFCKVPASEVIFQFLNDVKLVYPGFTKAK